MDILRFLGLVLFLPAAGLAVGTACGAHSCTQIGCLANTELQIAIVAASEALPDGSYTVQLTSDKGSKILTCPIAAGTMGGCTGSSKDVDGYFGYDVDSGKYGIVVTINNQPQTLSIVVSRNGAELTRQMLTTRYGLSYPNGPDCDSTGCPYASASPDRIII